MRHRIHLVLTAAALIAGTARADEAGQSEIRRDMAQALRSEFRYSPTASKHPEVSTPMESPKREDVIVMPKFTVLSSKINMRNLEGDILKHQARAKAQKPKWGCGPIYQKDFGKIRFGVFSIFYVPVLIGFSW